MILSMIKAHAGEGMRRTERERELSMVNKGRKRTRPEEKKGRNTMKGGRLKIRGYVKVGGRTCFAVDISHPVHQPCVERRV